MMATWIAIAAVGFSFLVSTRLPGFEMLLMLAYIATIGIISFWHIGGFLVIMMRRCWRKHGSSSSSTGPPANRSSV
ncbi:hypothetical protein Nepgr_009073 [Nepenthes gracilis]|uniref:Uncharacterized protein n=1 Tax=Nepenthes gracilis TaxID=150966 RepID=A0AAD3S9P9_NEPGR|nr:hypothetical protein Nepgr_009073 [Nepenthes gracilis]